MTPESNNAPQTGWIPTPKQRAMLDAAKSPGLNRTIVSIAEQANIAPKTFYSWIKHDPDFRAAWNDIWAVSIDDNMPGIVAAQMDKALAGSTRAADYLTNLAGKMIKRVDVTTGGEPIIGIEIVAPDGGE